MQFTNVTPAAILAHMVGTYGRIRARDSERNLANIAKPWNPDTEIKTVFNDGALCRELDAEGGNPITDASYVLILVKIFRESGVFPMEIREWSRLPEADKTVARCVEFFTEVYKSWMEETLQGALTANTAKADNTKTSSPDASSLPPKWEYCWTHGLCQHGGMTCKFPPPNHKQEATLDQPMGGSNQIRFPGQRRPPGRQRRQDKRAKSGQTATTALSATLSQASQVSGITEE